jgi:hypothetical protein
MAVARIFPALAEALGERFQEKFAAFATRTPLPRDGGPLADGFAFARSLADAGELPDQGKLEALAVELRFVSTANGLVRRRGPALKASLVEHPRRLVLGVHLPWLGMKWFAIPLSHRRTAGREK